MSLETIVDENLVESNVTITLIDFDTGNPIQETVRIKKPKRTKFSELAFEAVKAFNLIFEQKKCKYRIDSNATNYKVLPSAENKLKNYTQDNTLEELELFEFAFEYQLKNVIEIKKTSFFSRCLSCLCFKG